MDTKLSEMQNKMATLDTLIAKTVGPLAEQTKTDLAKLSADLKIDIDAVETKLQSYAPKSELAGLATKQQVATNDAAMRQTLQLQNQALATKASKGDVEAAVKASDCFKKGDLDGLLRRNAKTPTMSDYYDAKQNKWIVYVPPKEFTTCDKALKSNGNKKGMYPIKGKGMGSAKQAWCELVNGAGFLLVARVNGGESKWTFGETGDNTNSESAWETASTFGSPDSGSDYKSSFFNEMVPSKFMISRNKKMVLQSQHNCLGDKSMAGFFRSKKWTCGGSVGFPNGCANACKNEARGNAHADNVLNRNGASSLIYLHAGERNGVQESNEDRSYICGSSSRGNVDLPTGLGSYCTGTCGGERGSNNVGREDRDGTRKAGSSYTYEIWYN